MSRRLRTPYAVVILVIIGNDLASLYCHFPSRTTHCAAVGDAAEFVEIRHHATAWRWQRVFRQGVAKIGPKWEVDILRGGRFAIFIRVSCQLCGKRCQRFGVGGYCRRAVGFLILSWEATIMLGGILFNGIVSVDRLVSSVLTCASLVDVLRRGTATAAIMPIKITTMRISMSVKPVLLCGVDLSIESTFLWCVNVFFDGVSL